MAWNEAQKAEIIKAFFETGDSASVIASRYGCSRNAIIGLAHRHRARNGIAPQTRAAVGRSTHRKPQGKPTARPVTKRPALAIGKSAAFAAGRAGTAMLTKEFAAIGVRLLPLPPTARSVPLVELAAGECRFSVTPHHAGRDQHRFCGAPADGSYCAHHARLAHA
ncbi:GcrA cell cycle regulator [Mesorhizobium albiziae]|uniref:GcrA cell cycle regulator n=1 Tax=Neomesorhizobium albiziae TaxID=335020 RepID=A0A1I3YEF6_9HYPH|nr:GcrA family cell cycle regulator [Mesorhizobium albiziae]GLS29935.1 hypothetical protein GCM10007937_16430 [Mesorhizobium albiziae]SFK29759.1 GcrA cell cycle regulator [Mesorhizobium albiziae]